MPTTLYIFPVAKNSVSRGPFVLFFKPVALDHRFLHGCRRSGISEGSGRTSF